MKNDNYLRAKFPDEIKRQIMTFLRLKNTHKSFFNFIEGIVNPNKNTKVVEIGCGCGIMTNEIWKRWNCKSEGWDSNKNFIDFARKNFPKSNFYVKYFFSKNTENLLYDLIIFRETIMECKEPNDLIRWSLNFLKPGGYIAALEPDYGATIIYPEIPYWDEFMDSYSKFCKKYGDEDFFMGRKLINTFKRAGVEHIKIQPIIEVHSSLNSSQLKKFMNIEAMSIKSDMDLFIKNTGFDKKKATKIIRSLKLLYRHPGAYVQTTMVAICGQI